MLFPLTLTSCTARVSVPSLALLLLAGSSATTLKVTTAPAGIPTFPFASFTSSVTLAVMIFPALSCRECKESLEAR